MSKDIKAFKELREGEYGVNSVGEISSFTFSHRLNDYCGAMELFTQNYDEMIPETNGGVTFDTYVFKRDTIIKLKEMNDKSNIGKDVTDFINEILNSQLEVVYMQIF